MLRILKISTSGYKRLADNFVIDFTNIARVNKDDLEKEVFKINEKDYLFRVMTFIGGNSSGKSTTLNLIFKINMFLKTGRWQVLDGELNNNYLIFSVYFYLNGSYYYYFVKLKKQENFYVDNIPSYLLIDKEELKSLEFDKNKRIDYFDLSNYHNVDNILNYSLNDTSSITKITNMDNNYGVDYFYSNSLNDFNTLAIRNSFYYTFKECDNKLLISIINMLDESIEYIKMLEDNKFIIKRINEEEKTLNNNQLVLNLSSGTIKGIELLYRVFLSLKKGTILIIDEIENSFHKNLVNNILFLYNDTKINKNNAQLIFSTHYAEILDVIKRRDNIYITHKENGFVKAKNMYLYNIRTELEKSKLYNNNIFDTSINYEKMMNVRRIIIDEL